MSRAKKYSLLRASRLELLENAFDQRVCHFCPFSVLLLSFSTLFAPPSFVALTIVCQRLTIRWASSKTLSLVSNVLDSQGYQLPTWRSWFVSATGFPKLSCGFIAFIASTYLHIVRLSTNRIGFRLREGNWSLSFFPFFFIFLRGSFVELPAEGES